MGNESVFVGDVGDGDAGAVGSGVAVTSLSDLSFRFRIAGVLEVPGFLSLDFVTSFITEIGQGNFDLNYGNSILTSICMSRLR